MNLEGRTTRLRALEPGDIELMYAWENDPEIWGVSGTLAPFSRHTLERFIEGQQFDIFQTRQQRLIIETPEGLPVGALDLFDLDPVNLRAGVGILIHDTAQRGKGYAADAVETVCSYARDMLHVQRRSRKCGEPRTFPPCRILRNGDQERVAAACRRIPRRGFPAKNIMTCTG